MPGLAEVFRGVAEGALAIAVVDTVQGLQTVLGGLEALGSVSPHKSAWKV